MTTALQADRLSTILLCSYLALPAGEAAGAKPFPVDRYRQLIEKLAAVGWQPSDLLDHSAAEIEQALSVKPDTAERIVRLLERSGQLAFELERLAGQGIWVLTEADGDYPPRLLARLAEKAPPVLIGAGSRHLLVQSGIAIVGSRDIDAAGEEFARSFAARCAREELTVISGGARGADRVSMIGALEAGGAVVGVLADSLLQTLRDHDTARFIRDEQLTLITAVHPSAGFTVGNAMGRNKYLYGLAEAALVVSSAEETGGTWGGAIENLRHGWVPLFVRGGPDAPAGNHALIARGGTPLLPPALPVGGELLSGLLRLQPPPPPADWPLPTPPTTGGTPAEQSCDLYPVFWERLKPFLAEPRTKQDLASVFGLVPAQAQAWLERARREGRVEAVGRPLRYRLPAQRLL